MPIESKITVKHFLNSKVKHRFNFDGFKENYDNKGTLEIYNQSNEYQSLYVKITFKRNTTQWRSIVTMPVSSIEEANKYYHDALEAEKNMIIDIIKNIYSDNFSFKKVNEICENFKDPLLKVFFRSYWYDEYHASIYESDSKYKKILYPENPIDYSLNYYNAAFKLINSQKMKSFKNMIRKIEPIDTFMPTTVFGFPKTCAEWAFGSLKNQFKKAALNGGLKNEYIDFLIKEIDLRVFTDGEES